MKLIKNIFYNTSYQILTLIIPLFTVPYVARVLSPEGVGINAYTNSIVTYFILFGALGIALYGNREIAFVQNDKFRRSKVFWELVFLKFFSVGISIIAFLIFVFFSKQWQIYYLLNGVNLLATLIDISWYFLGVEDFKKIVVRNTFVRVITVVLTFLLVRTESDLGIYILLLSVSAFLGNLTVWPFLKKEVDWVPFNQLDIKSHIKPTLLLFFPQITMQIYLSLNKSMLGSLDGVVSAGYFDQSDKLIRILFTVVTAIGGVFLPRLSNLFSLKKDAEAKRLLLRLLDLSNAISMLMIGGTIGVSSTFAVFFFGSGYEPVGALMAVQSFMIIFISYGNALGTQYLLASRRTKAYTISAIAGLITNVILNVILIPISGAMGAIISTVITEFIVSFYQAMSLRDVFTIKELTRGCLRYIIAAVVVAFIVHYMDINMGISLINYAIQGLIGTVIYIVLIVIMKTPVVALFRKSKRV